MEQEEIKFEKQEEAEEEKKKEERRKKLESKSIVFLSELNKDDVWIAGGKGANLAELYRAKFPVPPAFIVTAQAYKKFIIESGLLEKINHILASIDIEDTKQLEAKTERIRKLIEEARMPTQLEEEIKEAYHMLEPSVHGTRIDSLLSSVHEPCFVAVRSSATTEDLANASFAGQQETFLNIKGDAALIEAIKKCWASLFTARATYYRERRGFSHAQAFIAVIVQKMVNADKAGVMFTANPLNNNKQELVIEAVFGLGEGIVSGSIEPDHLVIDKQTLQIKKKRIGRKLIEFTRDAEGRLIKKKLNEADSTKEVLTESEWKRLANYAIDIEKHYGFPQDIEYAIEGNNIYILQSRPITTLQKQVKSFHITGKEPLLEGLGASPGVAVGRVKIIHSLDELDKVQKGDVLVTQMTNPDMVVTMQKCAAIITEAGGATCHAAIVSREIGLPCVVGTKIATQLLEDGQLVTVDGTNGKVYDGKVEITEVEQVTSKLPETKTRIKVICDLPQIAYRAAATGAAGVGLVRIEFIIASGGKHPRKYLEEGKLNEYTALLYEGLKPIADAFQGKPVWVRTSDLRTDEYRQLLGGEAEPKETDPMIGWHGIRRSLDQPELLKAELLAIKQLHESGYSNVGIMIPFVISAQEVKRVKEIARELNIELSKDIDFGVMVETPAACWVIEDICKQGINFISFGTNDLTQLTLGVDRNNERIAHLYDEMHPAVLGEIKQVIRVCKQYGVKTSICGQAGSKPEMAKYLVKLGIDSISCNIDAFSKIKQVVRQVEEELGLWKQEGQEAGKLEPLHEKLPEAEEAEVEESQAEKEEEE